jgi:hypothetical protein
MDAVDGPLVGKKYLILDRDTKYCQEFALETTGMILNRDVHPWGRVSP